jgi:uncharacterized repeat protein (TIGR03803 family)
MKRIFFSLFAGAIVCASALPFPAPAIARGKETVLFRFDQTDGARPVGGLIDVKGTLYGTTAYGGGGAHCVESYACGTVFTVDQKTGAETVLYSFCSRKECVDGQNPSASLIDVDGTLYGVTTSGGTVTCAKDPHLGCGTVFALNVKTGAQTVVHSFANGGTDGAYPNAGLIDLNGTLYGTTSGGGRTAKVIISAAAAPCSRSILPPVR